MIPPNILLRLGMCPDVPKDWMQKIPQYAIPLDAGNKVPYLGEIRFDTDMMKCYTYTENGWKGLQ